MLFSSDRANCSPKRREFFISEIGVVFRTKEALQWPMRKSAARSNLLLFSYHSTAGVEQTLVRGTAEGIEFPVRLCESVRETPPGDRVMRCFGFLFVLVLVIGAAISSFAQTPSTSKSDDGFSIDNIDKTVDPCVDFYQYACGNWLKKTEIPADRSSWGSFAELDERNLGIERGILEKAAAGGASRDGIDQRIGDLYASCMDEKTVNEKALAPVKPELDRVAAVQDKGALVEELAHLYLIGAPSLFSFYSNSDLHN